MNAILRLAACRAWRPLLAALVFATAAGCATVPGGDAAQASAGGVPSVVRQVNPKDPFEPWNRRVYAFNEVVDENVLQPVARTYVKVMPEFARTTIGNFFGNFGDAWSTVNHFLQGKVQSGLEMGMRVAVNSVFGIGGLLDIATEAGLERRDEDFGQTLGVWGVPAGPYLVWPILGPSSMRETAAMPLDRGWTPGLVINDGNATAGLATLQIVDTRARLLNASRLLGDVALDKYVFTRDAYLSRRRSLVYDGDPPSEPEEDPEPPEPKSEPKSDPKPAAKPVEPK